MKLETALLSALKSGLTLTLDYSKAEQRTLGTAIEAKGYKVSWTGKPALAVQVLPTAMVDTVRRLDRGNGGYNFVSLVQLRAAYPSLSRTLFDSMLHQCRLQGALTLVSAEGRGGLTPEEKAAGILEEGRLLLYVSVRPEFQG